MVTCESCFHYEACKPFVEHCNKLADSYKLPFPFKANNVKELCKNFKDKTSIVELPVMPGDTVYSTNNDYRFPTEIDGIHIDEQGVHFGWVQYEVGVEITELWDEGEFDIDEIGKTVFLTFEEFEKALKQLKRNEGGDLNVSDKK